MRRSLAITWNGGCLGCGCGCASLVAVVTLLAVLFGILPRSAQEHGRTLALCAIAMLLVTLGLTLTMRGKSFVRAAISFRKPPPDDRSA
jgi:hypothetical protein